MTTHHLDALGNPIAVGDVVLRGGHYHRTGLFKGEVVGASRTKLRVKFDDLLHGKAVSLQPRNVVVINGLLQ